MSLALMGALVAIGVALTFVLAGGDDSREVGTPPVWAFAVIAGVGVVVAGVIHTVGYRPQLNGRNRSGTGAASPVMIYQQLMILRFALAESVAIVSIALTFVVQPTSIAIYLFGAAISLVLMLIHVWPHRYPIERTERAIEAAGGPSGLSADLQG